MWMITLCIAPRLVKNELADEFRKNKKERFPCDYLVIYQKSDKQDDTKDTIYNMWVYKQIGGYPIRWEENLNELLAFLSKEIDKDRPIHMQIVNWDD